MNRPLIQPPPPTAAVAKMSRVDRWSGHRVPAKTREAYAYWQDRYATEFCPAHGILISYPCSDGQLADFVAWLIEEGTKDAPGRPKQAYSPNSIPQAISAIVAAHTADGLATPDTSHASLVADGYRRWMVEQDWSERKADPLTRGQILLMVANIDLSKPVGLRDKAIILAGFFTIRRASTIAAWNLADYKEHPNGRILQVRTSKTDPTGKRDDFATLTREQLALDPIAALDDWTTWLRGQAGGRGGPLFRQMSKHGDKLYVYPAARSAEARRGRLTTRTIRNVIERRLADSGVDRLGDFTGHSLRVGGFNDARTVRKWEYGQICTQGGWALNSSEAMGYWRHLERWDTA